MAGEIGNAASGAVTSQNFMKTTDYAAKEAALAQSLDEISGSHARAGAQAAAEAGVMLNPTGAQESAALVAPLAVEAPLAQPAAPQAEVAPLPAAPAPVAPEAHTQPSSIEQAWQDVQGLLQQKELGSRFVTTDTGIQLEIYDGDNKVGSGAQLDSVLKSKYPDNWQMVKDQLGTFIGQATKEFFTNSDGLKAISALPEKLPTPPTEKKQGLGLWKGLSKIAGEAIKGLGDWLSAKDVREANKAALANPETVSKVQVATERGQKRIMERVLGLFKMDKESRAQRRVESRRIIKENLDSEMVKRALERQNTLTLAEPRRGREILRSYDHYEHQLAKTRRAIENALNIKDDHEQIILSLTGDIRGLNEEIIREVKLLEELKSGQSEKSFYGETVTARDYKRRDQLMNQRAILESSLRYYQARLEVVKRAEAGFHKDEADLIGQRTPPTTPVERDEVLSWQAAGQPGLEEANQAVPPSTRITTAVPAYGAVAGKV